LTSTAIRKIDETQIGFVDERGRVQGVAGLLAGHVAVRHPAELRLDLGEELLQSSPHALDEGCRQD
jgi:hypothetical protein